MAKRPGPAKSPGAKSLGEFALIEKYFAPLAAGYPLAFGLRDDAAFLKPRAGRDLVVTKDVVVAGVHFFKDDPADLVARKALRVNLSDLAAKGARPIGYLLGASLPKRLDERWLKRFAAGLATDQKEFKLSLMGGDTVSTPGPLTLSITAIGDVPAGQRLRRAGARLGDDIYVTGTIGDATLGLALLHGKIDCRNKRLREFLAARYRLPRPRLAVGAGLLAIANTCLDVSDGLVADLGHICENSALGAEITADAVPLSPAARVVLGRYPRLVNRLLTGGDDYELVFTAAPGQSRIIVGLARRTGVAITRIGRMIKGSGVRVIGENGRPMTLKRAGYAHF